MRIDGETIDQVYVLPRYQRREFRLGPDHRIHPVKAAAEVGRSAAVHDRVVLLLILVRAALRRLAMRPRAMRRGSSSISLGSQSSRYFGTRRRRRPGGCHRSRPGAGPGARRRGRASSGTGPQAEQDHGRPVVAHIGPQSTCRRACLGQGSHSACRMGWGQGSHSACRMGWGQGPPSACRMGWGQDRHGGVVTMDALGRQHVGTDQRDEGRQGRGARADPIGERRHIQLDPLAGERLALPVQWQVLAELRLQDRRQQLRPGTPTRNHVERCGRLMERLAGPAGHALAHSLDHLELPRDHLQRLGHVLAEFGQLALAAGAGRPGRARRPARVGGGRGTERGWACAGWGASWCPPAAGWPGRRPRPRWRRPPSPPVATRVGPAACGRAQTRRRTAHAASWRSCLSWAMTASAPDARCSAARRAACSASSAACKKATSSGSGAGALVTAGCKHKRRRVGYCGMQGCGAFLSRRLGPPGVLRVPPIDAVQHVAELGRRDRHNAAGWRGPDEPAALQPLGVERHSDPVVPEDLHEVPALAPEHVQVARMRIPLKCLLHLECEAIHAAPHVGVPHREPNPDGRGNRDQRRTAAMTRRSVARPTSAPTRMQVPSGSAISIRRSLPAGSGAPRGPGSVGAGTDGNGSGSICTGMNTGA